MAGLKSEVVEQNRLVKRAFVDGIRMVHVVPPAQEMLSRSIG